MNQISFVVRARCPTKGSTVSFKHKSTNKIVTMQRNAKQLKQFDALVVSEASKHFIGPVTGCVCIGADFFFKAPKSYRDKSGAIKRGKTAASRSFGDLDKLCRSLLDALTGVVYVDDSQVVVLHAEKALANEDFVMITIEEVFAPHSA